MSAVVPFVRPMSAQRADGVFAAVNEAARRYGLPGPAAYQAAFDAKALYKRGVGSASRVVSLVTAELRQRAEKVSA
jgi:hypothetical protein